MPTMFVLFTRARENKELLVGASPGSTAEYHPSGWMETEIFLKWFHRFIKFPKTTERKPLLVLLDGHESQTESLELIELARKSHVVLMCFPSHTTHRLQSLDVFFMAPLNHYCWDETWKWLQLHPGRVVTIKQVVRLHGAPFMKAASVETAVNGSVTSETLGLSHWSQTFFQIRCFNHLKPQIDRFHKSLLTQHLWQWEIVVMMLIHSHIRIQRLPYGLLVKSQELTAFNQRSMKPLFKISPQDILLTPEKMN
jgi:hypothetical protein